MLITLGIIGVVAALTIPTLITNHQKKVTIERLKKVYTSFSNAYIRSQVDNGEMQYWQFPTASNDKEQNGVFFDRYFRPYMNIIAKNSHPDFQSVYYRYPDYSFSDGTIFRFSAHPNGYVYIIVDINGMTKPNRAGRDIFYMNIYPQVGVRFFGNVTVRRTREELIQGVRINNGADVSCCSNTCSQGIYKYNNCGALIQVDGWQIKDDYPW